MNERISLQNRALKRWRFFVIFWPLLCFVLAGIIICQSNRTIDERISDVMFTILPLIFFAIGMSIRFRLLKERGNATVLATAVVVSEGRRKRTGENKSYFPEFEFQVHGITYRVTALRGSGFELVKMGDKITLYYTEENPRLFYVPVLQRHDSRCSLLFCGIGVVFPLIGLLAPQLREFFSSLL